MAIKVDKTLDAKGLACPMPIVRTKKAMTDLEGGQVLEVEATDKGSKADLKAWAEGTGHQYIGTVEEGDVLKHYLRKSSGEEAKEKKYPHVINNVELQSKLDNNEEMTILDVREEAEYAFDHIPGAQSIPLGELEEKMEQLDKNENYYVICRTGNRSDMASQKLAEHGFEHVVNVVPGMSEWTNKEQK
ncbi:sulfurtransferase TusA family protein [Bacillus sp. 1P06AnD]|uniref:sulfurtransferase TusA family protein n=1 Tax=Bacillus sp. 1P06AnD TaxID=3132208 RepID=UPI0039A10226